MPFDVLTYGNDWLRKRARPVGEVNDDIRRMVREMLQTMYAADGIGLAAEQVGREEAVCVIDLPAASDRDSDGLRANPSVGMPLVLIDPHLDAASGKQKGQEGCLSFPEVFVDIERAQDVAVTYTALDGARRTVQATGLLSRAIQHELDHLNGVLLVDRMSPVQRVAAAGKLKRIRKRALQEMPVL